ncbi:homeobox-leucine zipper protein HAT14-like [Aristolochia californica]|uniref:homeobox-leucine zipper protein HAT14-like n=1 Tax=Aristolochia californica TaxID=171875 RepID=UPI0035DE37ED
MLGSTAFSSPRFFLRAEQKSMEEEDLCNTGLVLGIGSAQFSAAASSSDRRTQLPVKFHLLFPPHTQKTAEEQDVERSSSKTTDDDEDYSNRNFSSEVNNTSNVPRKKLRLSKEQSALLEESFKEHSTLTPTQKQELAARLNLRPRQVEVWFQNRRARTKLKQTEVDCEFLKKCCESLSDENRRLKKELQELRSVKMGTPFYIQLPRGPTNVTMCPSCEKVAPVDSNNSFDVSKSKLYGVMKDSSMAC